EKAAAEGNPRAQLVTKITAYQIKKFIGAYTAAMDGIDALVFTAGLGENNPELRSRVCAGLSFLGIKIDEELNAVSHHQPNIVKLSTDESKVLVYLIPTNEEKVIAQDTERLAREFLAK
ncbi:MAG: acetate kinase, partial [Clostridia bacterium]|nr:acetate kinase [Clostridia bacterium]